MDFREYQLLAGRTSPKKQSDPSNHNITNFAMGLSGEAGETVDYLKKVVFHGHDLDKEVLKKELGDVLWYISAICYEYNIWLEEVAELNIDKLKKRYPEGFSEEDSIKRVDVDDDELSYEGKMEFRRQLIEHLSKKDDGK